MPVSRAPVNRLVSARDFRVKSNSKPVGTLEAARQHALRLLESQPALAFEQAAEILKVSANHPQAMLVAGAARRLCRDPAGAELTLKSFSHALPGAMVGANGQPGVVVAS